MKPTTLTRPVVGILMTILLIGCSSVKNMSLLQDLPPETDLPPYPEFVIEVGDQLLISITAINPQAAAPFNTGTALLVHNDGTIDMPILGHVAVAGQTTNQVKQTILALVSENLQNAFVNIYVSNASIYVMGEVNNPLKMGIDKPITILNAIGEAGGLTTNAQSKQVEVIRTMDNRMDKYILDLTSPELMQSPCFYLTKGDIVNVLPKLPVLIK